MPTARRQPELRAGRIFLRMVAYVAILAACGAYAPAATYYVAPSGLDGNDGSSQAPFATIQAAANIVNPGDTVIVRDGTYGGSYSSGYLVWMTRSGTADAPITFRAEHKWGAVLDGESNTGQWGWGFSGGGISYITVQDFEVTGFAKDGFTASSGSQNHITLRGNHIHHIGVGDSTSSIGINGIFDGTGTQYMMYDGNVIHNIGRTGPPTEQFNMDHGIYTCGSHNVITNNIFYDCNAGWGVQVAGYTAVDGTVISNNVFAGGYKCGQIVLWQTCQNTTIQNNIFYDPAVLNAINYVSAVLSGVAIRNNLVFGGGLMDAPPSGVVASQNLSGQDPLFAGPTGHDFHLQPGSPAIGAGTPDLAPATDIDGLVRPQGAGIDIGAYQIASSPAAAFTASLTTGLAPLTVQFADASTGSPSSWSWSFGDGGTSSLSNPTHQYAAVGVYTVSLAVANSAGSSTVTKAGYITILSPLSLILSADKPGALPGDTVTYTVAYRNMGQLPLANVQLVEQLPAGTTYVPGSASSSGVCDGRQVAWNLGALAAGASGTVTFSVTMN